MNLLRLITREDPIAGLEISDTALRLALFRFDEKGTFPVLATTAEEPLQKGIIVNGNVADPELLARALVALVKKAPEKVRYVIASIPSEQIYTHVYSFPQTIRGEKLEESMQLTVGFQLPFKLNDVYLDWEKIPSKEENDIFLAAVPRPVVDRYLQALEKANLRPVALETHALSLMRVIEFPEPTPFLLTTSSASGRQLTILDKTAIRFSRFLPKNFRDEQKEEETQKLRDFYAADHGELGPTLSQDDLTMVGVLASQGAAAQNPTAWLISFGSGLRGLLPRSQDALVSLLPVGTEEAYEFQKAISFIEFLSSVTVGLSAFFALAFIGVWVLFGSLQDRAVNRIATLSASPLPPETAAIEERAIRLNALLGTTAGILDTFPQWRTVIDEVHKRTPRGITLSTLSFPAPDAVLTIAAVANDRTQLNIFKRQLSESPIFTNIQFPLTAIEMKENIPFSVSFRLADPAALYLDALPEDIPQNSVE